MEVRERIARTWLGTMPVFSEKPSFPPKASMTAAKLSITARYTM